MPSLRDRLKAATVAAMKQIKEEKAAREAARAALKDGGSSAVDAFKKTADPLLLAQMEEDMLRAEQDMLDEANGVVRQREMEKERQRDAAARKAREQKEQEEREAAERLEERRRYMLAMAMQKQLAEDAEKERIRGIEEAKMVEIAEEEDEIQIVVEAEREEQRVANRVILEAEILAAAIEEDKETVRLEVLAEEQRLLAEEEERKAAAARQEELFKQRPDLRYDTSGGGMGAFLAGTPSDGASRRSTSKPSTRHQTPGTAGTAGMIPGATPTSAGEASYFGEEDEWLPQLSRETRGPMRHLGITMLGGPPMLLSPCSVAELTNLLRYASVRLERWNAKLLRDLYSELIRQETILFSRRIQGPRDGSDLIWQEGQSMFGSPLRYIEGEVDSRVSTPAPASFGAVSAVAVRRGELPPPLCPHLILKRRSLSVQLVNEVGNQELVMSGDVGVVGSGEWKAEVQQQLSRRLGAKLKDSDKASDKAIKTAVAELCIESEGRMVEREWNSVNISERTTYPGLECERTHYVVQLSVSGLPPHGFVTNPRGRAHAWEWVPTADLIGALGGGRPMMGVFDPHPPEFAFAGPGVDPQPRTPPRSPTLLTPVSSRRGSQSRGALLSQTDGASHRLHKPPGLAVSVSSPALRRDAASLHGTSPLARMRGMPHSDQKPPAESLYPPVLYPASVPAPRGRRDWRSPSGPPPPPPGASPARPPVLLKPLPTHPSPPNQIQQQQQKQQQQQPTPKPSRSSPLLTSWTAAARMGRLEALGRAWAERAAADFEQGGM